MDSNNILKEIEKNIGTNHVALVEDQNNLFRLLSNGEKSSLDYNFFNKSILLEEAIYALSLSNLKGEVYKVSFEPVEVLLEIVEKQIEKEECKKESIKNIVNT